MILTGKALNLIKMKMLRKEMALKEKAKARVEAVKEAKRWSQKRSVNDRRDNSKQSLP